MTAQGKDFRIHVGIVGHLHLGLEINEVALPSDRAFLQNRRLVHVEHHLGTPTQQRIIQGATFRLRHQREVIIQIDTLDVGITIGLAPIRISIGDDNHLDSLE